MASFFNNGGLEMVLGALVITFVLIKAAIEEKRYVRLTIKKN